MTQYCEMCENVEVTCPTATPGIGLCKRCFADQFCDVASSLFPYTPCGYPMHDSSGVLAGVCTNPRSTCKLHRA